MSVLDLQAIVREVGLLGTYPELVTHADKKAALVINAMRKAFDNYMDVDAILSASHTALKLRCEMDPTDDNWKELQQLHLDGLKYADALSHMYTRVEAIREERRTRVNPHRTLEETPVQTLINDFIAANTSTPPGVVVG